MIKSGNKKCFMSSTMRAEQFKSSKIEDLDHISYPIILPVYS